MKTIIRQTYICVLLACSLGARSQDIHFSQIFETPLLRNPSLAGLFAGDIRMQAVHRSQWNSVTIPYQTTSLSGEVKIPVGRGDDYLTVGGQLLYDKAGSAVLTATHVLPAVNYHKSLSADKNQYLSLGFMGGMVQRRVDQTKMTTNSQFDGTQFNPALGTGEALSRPSYTYLDGSVGLSFNSQLGENDLNNFFIGVAYHHFNRSKNISFYSATEIEMQPKTVASGGIRLSMTDNSYFTLQADHSRQGTYTETVAGALYSWKLGEGTESPYAFHAGTYFRWKDAVIPVAKLEMKPLAVAVSYDANISQLKPGSRGQGGFEVALTYQAYKKSLTSSQEAVRCPKF